MKYNDIDFVETLKHVYLDDDAPEWFLPHDYGIRGEKLRKMMMRLRHNGALDRKTDTKGRVRLKFNRNFNNIYRNLTNDPIPERHKIDLKRP